MFDREYSPHHNTKKKKKAVGKFPRPLNNERVVNKASLIFHSSLAFNNLLICTHQHRASCKTHEVTEKHSVPSGLVPFIW